MEQDERSGDDRGAAASITRGAVVAAMYAALTLALEPLSFGPVQVRVAEALTVLPILVDEAVAGLFVGCLLANLFGGLGLVDVVAGSLTTLSAAWLTRRLRDSWAAYAMPVALNGLVVGTYLALLYDLPLWSTIPSILAGELVAVVGLGVALVRTLRGRIPTDESPPLRVHA